MRNVLNGLSVTQKLNFSSIATVLLVVGMVGFSQLSLNNLRDIFTDYRTQARESLILANLFEYFSEVRTAALSYRTEDSDELAEKVHFYIKKMADQKAKIDDIVVDKEHHAKLMELEQKLLEYGKVFDQSVAKQAERHQIVARMDTIGPVLRKDLTEIMKSAYKDGDAAAAYYAGRVQEHYMLARFYARNFLVENKAEDAERTIAELKWAAERLATLDKSLENPRRREILGEVVDGVQKYEQAFSEVVITVNARNKLYTDGLDKIGSEVLKGYDSLFKEVQKKQNYLGPKAVQTMSRIATISIAVGGFIAVMVITVSLLISRFMKKNFRLIITQTNRLAKGDKEFKIQGANRSDEIGEVSKALQVFQDNMIEREKLEAQAKLKQDKELERAQNVQESVKKFEGEIEVIMGALTDSSSNLNVLSADLTDTMANMTSKSASVENISRETSANVNTVASATEEMSASVQEISQNVTDTAHTARACSDAAKLSQEKLSELQNAIDDIDNVIQAINDVADQTNLLALNATIEAARAGDAGKGFAVVAHEVKSLASETRKMTEEITNKVEYVKATSEQTIKSVSNIIDKVGAVDEKTNSVAAAVEEQNATTVEISRNVQEAANGTNKVSSNITEVLSAAKSSSEATQTLKSASDDLAEQASKIRASVEGFLKTVRN